MKQDQVNTGSKSGAAGKQEDSLPYMLGPSLDQQQLDQQALQDAGASMNTGIAVSGSQTDKPEFQPQSSNPIAQGQAQIFGGKNQQCEKHIKSFYHISIPTDEISP